jgi:hypothetical protein
MDGKRLGGMTFTIGVLDKMYAAGLDDDDIADAALEARLFHSRLTRQQRRTLQREARWLKQQDTRTLTPEAFARKASNLLRMFLDIETPRGSCPFKSGNCDQPAGRLHPQVIGLHQPHRCTAERRSP